MDAVAAPDMTNVADKTSPTAAPPALLDTYAQFPLQIASGRGSRVRDVHGSEYWDFYGGHAVALLGHSHPAVTRAVAQQCDSLAFYSNVVPLEIRTRAAERLCRFAGAGLEHVFFCNSGGEANENALKLSIQQTGRARLATLEGGWHGRTTLALAVTTEEKLRRPMSRVLCDCVRLTPNDCSAENLARLDESVAATMVEPIQSIAGIVALTPEFLAALRRRCDAVGALLIYDEVQTGMGRLGRPFVAGWHGVSADMVTSAKGIANGIPMGAVLMTARVASRVGQGDLGSTFGGGPVACAAMLAVLEAIERDELVASAERLGRLMHESLRVGPVQTVLGRGCLIGLRVGGGAKALQAALFEHGFIVGTSADPNVIRLMPPINTPEAAVEELARRLKDEG
ncbi:MAG: aminotransferase class III-fold pyridoxal phosphate-dependent enzyme [Phycisphaerae bacterium]